MVTYIALSSFKTDKNTMFASQSNFLAGSSSSRQTNEENLVSAWWNEDTKQWQTPAPWDPSFRKYEAEHGVTKVNRSFVHISERR